MKKIYAIPGKSLSLGRLGENERTQIVFPVTDWLEEYPDASIVLFNKRPKETQEYPVVITGPENGEVFWTVENTELAIDGDGECMLQIMEDSVVAKSANWRTKILPALTGADDPPEPWESLMDDMAELVGQAQDAAEDAADSAEDAAESAAAAETAGATAGAEAGATAGAAAGATAGASAGAAAAANLIDDTAGRGDTGKTWSADKIVGELGEKYEKPSGGIPATDLASGVIPDPEDLIDDTAGVGDTDKVVSADKHATDHNALLNAINGKQDAPETAGTAGQVLSLDSNLDPVWTTPQSGGGAVDDVQINGTSVVSGGVANIPIADNNSTYGLVKVRNGTDGIVVASNGALSVAISTGSYIKTGTESRKVLTPAHQHVSTFYGLSKIAGYDLKNVTVTEGTYPEESKSAISEMLNGAISVSGTTPSITAKAGVRYVCGEVSTLTIVVPASGCIDVTFTSGSTATVLTVTPPTGMTMKWANGFDPTALEANTTYEINIMDGCLGVAGSWT